jgi:hypothetical protein
MGWGLGLEDRVAVPRWGRRRRRSVQVENVVDYEQGS